jgi:hypothetical protein
MSVLLGLIDDGRISKRPFEVKEGALPERS